MIIASSSPAQHFFTAFGAGIATFGVFFLLVGWIIRRTSRHLRGPARGREHVGVHMTVHGDGSLGDALFGPHASGIGSLDREVTVTFGPDFTLRELAVTGSGDGVWETTGAGGQAPEGSAHGGTSGGGGGENSGGGSGEGGKSEPLLSVSHEAAGGEGVGSKFVGTLDLSNDPAAQAALEQVLAGNTSQIPVLIADMNAHGTEYTQSYHLKTSTSTYGGEVNSGGGGAELSDGSSSACYDPPRVRQNGGPWTTTTWNSGQTC